MDVERFLQNIDRTDTCWLWKKSVNKLGYGNFHVGDKNLAAHRVAWELLRGPIPPGVHVLHHCDNRRCVNPDHLYLGSHRDNMRDKINRDRGNLRKLTREQVDLVRNSDERPCDLARSLGVSTNTVWRVRTGRYYRY